MPEKLTAFKVSSPEERPMEDLDKRSVIWSTTFLLPEDGFKIFFKPERLN